MKDRIIKITEKSDWTLIKDQNNIKMLQYQNGANKMNVYYGTMTVLVLNKGGQPESHVNVDLDELKELFGVKEKTFFEKITSLWQRH